MTQPVSGTAEWGAAYAFSIETPHTPYPLWCQWRHNGREIPGEIQETLLLDNITTNDAGVYDVLVSNCSGGFVWSAPASLTVLMDPPQFAKPPQNLALPLGIDAAFSCVVTGAFPLQLQWYFNGEPLAKQTNASLSFQFTNLVQMGTYRVVASNLFGLAGAEATLVATNMVMEEPALLSTGEFEFRIYNPSHATCRIQASEDLVHWEDIFTFSNNQGVTVYRDTDAPFYPRLFYRVVSP
jgi:hypothetical protein